jgi:endonuclease YncB( thermonuclease family)
MGPGYSTATLSSLDDATYRLWGIDAAEARQACADGWPAGVEASRYLDELVAGRAVSCESKDRDRHGRTFALSRADAQDLGAAMVRAGMAWAFVRYSSDYVEQERAAIGAGAGVHAHGCVPAWEWRTGKRL